MKNLYSLLHAIFAGGCLTVTHDSEELTIISFFARENLLCQKHNNFLKLLFTQTSSKDIGMISSVFFLLSLMLPLIQNHVQFIVNKGFPNFCSKVQTQVLSLCFYIYVATLGSLLFIEFCYMKLVFYGSIIFQIRFYTCHTYPFFVI